MVQEVGAAAPKLEVASKSDTNRSAKNTDGTAKFADMIAGDGTQAPTPNAGPEQAERTAPYGAVARQEGDGIRITTPDGRFLTKVAATSNPESIASHFTRFDIDPDSYLRALGANTYALRAAEQYLDSRSPNIYTARGSEFLRPVADFDSRSVEDVLPASQRHVPGSERSIGRSEALGNQANEFSHNGLVPFNWALIAEQDNPLDAARAARSAMRSDAEWQRVSAAYSALRGYEYTGIYGANSTDLLKQVFEPDDGTW
jgi:hypothetical protein